MTDGVTTVVSYYTFGSMRVAVKRGNTLYHLHGDHLGSTSLTTAGSTVEASRAYYAYGAERAATGDLQTDRTFTGQKADATGLLYYNARYYDPALGTFISPDSLVPNPARVLDYNRFLYARGNPLRYTDPTGHQGFDIPNPFDEIPERLGLPSTRELGEKLNVDWLENLSGEVYRKIYEVVSDITHRVETYVLKPAIEMGLGFVPGYDIATAVVGKTITGESLSGWERGLTAIIELTFAVPSSVGRMGVSGLRKLTAGNARENLIRHTGVDSATIVTSDAHHVLP